MRALIYPELVRFIGHPGLKSHKVVLDFLIPEFIEVKKSEAGGEGCM